MIDGHSGTFALHNEVGLRVSEPVCLCCGKRNRFIVSGRQLITLPAASRFDYEQLKASVTNKWLLKSSFWLNKQSFPLISGRPRIMSQTARILPGILFQHIFAENRRRSMAGLLKPVNLKKTGNAPDTSGRSLAAGSFPTERNVYVAWSGHRLRRMFAAGKSVFTISGELFRINGRRFYH